MVSDKPYTTGQVAKMTGLSMNTVIRCYEKGLLKGFIVPGSRHRRILRDSFRQFVADHGITVREAAK